MILSIVDICYFCLTKIDERLLKEFIYLLGDSIRFQEI